MLPGKQYEGLLSRRNYLLRERASDDLIETYTEKLIHVGKKIIKGRLEYLRLYTPLIKEFYYRLGMNNQSLILRYQPFGYHLDNEGGIHMEKGFEMVKEEEREREITIIGPHRDEIVLRRMTEFRTLIPRRKICLSSITEMSVYN